MLNGFKLLKKYFFLVTATSHRGQGHNTEGSRFNDAIRNIHEILPDVSVT